MLLKRGYQVRLINNKYMAKPKGLSGEGGQGAEFRPNLTRAYEAAVLHTRPEIIGARAKVMMDEAQIYNTLATELLEESIAQRMLADRHGITLPADAGANAIDKIKAKYFSKMDQTQLVDSFRNITSRISERRRTDPEYVNNVEYRMDTYWLKGLLQRMQDTRDIDDPQGLAESQIMADIGTAGEDPDEYSSYLKSYSASDRARSARVNAGSKRDFNLSGILGDGTKRDAFKLVLAKIGLTADLLSSNISPADIADMLVKIDRELASYDLVPVGINASDLKSFVSDLPSVGASVINDLKSVVS